MSETPSIESGIWSFRGAAPRIESSDVVSDGVPPTTIGVQAVDGSDTIPFIESTNRLFGPILSKIIDRVQTSVDQLVVASTIHHIPTRTGETVAVHESIGSGIHGTIIAIHGMGSCVSDWTRFVRQAKLRFGRVLMVDLPGHGLSVLPEKHNRQFGPAYDGYTETPDFMWFIDSVLDAIDAVIRDTESTTLLGNSFGGAVACKIAASRPDMFDRLVLSSPSGYTCDDAEKKRIHSLFLPTTYADAVDFTLRLSPPPNAIHGYIMATMTKERLSLPVVGVFRDSICFAKEDYTFITDEVMADISCRTLMVWGDADKILLPVNATHFSKIKGIDIIRPVGWGHAPHHDDPDELMNMIERFIGNGIDR
jgi:pimeloyl-ACP methyl ester carboxylesterase